MVIVLHSAREDVMGLIDGMARWAPTQAVNELHQLQSKTTNDPGEWTVHDLLNTYRLFKTTCGWGARFGIERSRMSAPLRALELVEAMLSRFLWGRGSPQLRTEARALFAELLAQSRVGKLADEVEALWMVEDILAYINLRLDCFGYLGLLARKPTAAPLVARIKDAVSISLSQHVLTDALALARTFYLEAVGRARESAREIVDIVQGGRRSEGLLVETIGFEADMVIQELERSRISYCVVYPNYPFEPLKGAQKFFYRRMALEWARRYGPDDSSKNSYKGG